MADELMQLIAANVAGDLIQLATSIEDIAGKYANYAEVDLTTYKVGTSEWRAASVEQADFEALLHDAKQLRKIANGVAVRQLGGELADGIERTGTRPADTAGGGTYRPARCSCGGTGSGGTVERTSTTDATAGLDRSGS